MSVLFWPAVVLAKILRVGRIPEMYHRRQDYPARRRLHAEPQYRSFREGRGSVRGSPYRLVARLCMRVSIILSVHAPFSEHASFCDLGERQARAPLQVDVLAVYEGGERG